jgi:murein L,D-transpeptidase YafK
MDLYRFEGPSAAAAQMEKLLCSKNYWLERLHNKDVKWGYYESADDLLVCIKKEKILEVLKNENGKFKQIDKIGVLTGLDGQKEKEGDLRTPIGVYTIKAVIDNVESFYGPFAFVTSYPNMLDRIENKDGHGIWIHGMPIDGKRDNNKTKGCIVMNNAMLEKLKNEINYQKTYLLISENAPFTSDKEEISEILAFIYRWRNAWKNSDFEKYKTFYAKDFKKPDGTDLKQFFNYKKRVFENKKHQKVEIYFSDINIIPYQNIKGVKLFRIDMYEKYLSNSYKFRGKKELYVRFGPDGLKIIAEK